MTESEKDETSDSILQNVNNYRIKAGNSSIEKKFSPLGRQVRVFFASECVLRGSSLIALD